MYLTFNVVNYTADVFITSFSVREKSLHHLDTFNTILTGIREQESDAKRRPRLLFKQRPNKAASSRGRKRSWKQKKKHFQTVEGHGIVECTLFKKCFHESR